MSKDDFKSRKIKSPDGIIRIIFDSKLHSWDEASIQYPKEMKKKDEYYLYGIQKTKDEWLEARRDRIGEPPCKQASVREVIQSIFIRDKIL